MSLVLLESDSWRLWCDPSMGVQWLAAEAHRDGQWHALVPDCRSPDGLGDGQSPNAPLPAANFHMLPYSNRIRDGQFLFQEQRYRLQNAKYHAIHGALRKLPWQQDHKDASSLHCSFDSTQHKAVNWPWPITATIHQTLNGPTLESTLSLTNQGLTDMPAGFGWHPYFNRQVNGAEPTLTLPVNGVFPDEEGDCLPDGAAIVLPGHLDFRQPKSLQADHFIDCCLSGLAGPCIIDWKAGGIKLVMQASELCQYLVLYNPDMPHFAIEPVTNANDAFNLSSQGIESGTRTLSPKETLTATMSLTVEVS